jgi:tetratricopeptide (TPR) repeat protein
MVTDDVKKENKRNYLKLLVSLEASQGILNLLIAVCDDRNLQARLIQEYEDELKKEGFLCYRVRVRTHDPSLTYALGKLVESDINLQQQLQQKKPAVITVVGVDELLSVRLDAPKSEQERFFGYLQWTREALRQFHFPVVLWVSDAVVTRLAQKAPDFWSWRGGVFWFARESSPVEIQNIANSNIGYVTSKTVTKEVSGLPLEEILRLIDNIESQGKDSPLLSTLYDSLGQAYQQRYDNAENRKLAIAAYEKAIALQTKLNLKADLASSWENLGNLYFERRHNSQKAENCYGKALAIYQQIGDKNGEANTLQAIGDVLQFLKRSDEALSRYEQALSFYREIGDRLGEANVLQELGKLESDPKQSLVYLQQAQNLYQQIGDIYSQSRNLIYFLAEVQLKGDKAAAINSLILGEELAAKINYQPFQKDAQEKLAEIQDDET